MADLDLLGTCVASQWQPVIGDPTTLGWATVAAYGLTAGLAARVAWSLTGRDRLIWAATALLLALLMVNKQLDLQSFLTAAARCHAVEAGWYEDRRAVQRLFILGVAGTAVTGFALAAWIFRGSLVRNFLLLTGMFLLLAFIAIRAAGMHGVDAFIGLTVGPARMNHVLELGAISILALAALTRRG